MEQYTVTGMSCAACSARVEKAVKAVPGVTSCSVSLLTNSMGVEGTASASAIVKAVQEAGYGASPKAAAAETSSAELDALADHETPRLKKRLIASLVFLAVLMYFSMGHMMWGWPLPHWFDGNHVAMGLVQLLLAGIVMVINQKFFISGFKGLLHRAPNMDTLVALGSSASFLWSTYALFAMTRADTGIAIGAGTDVAIDAADVVLMNSRLSDVPAAIRLSRATLRNIHENLFWAFIYNIIGIPLAAGVFIPFGLTLNPMFGAAAMSLSSFCVVSNALRLNLFDLHSTKHDRKPKSAALPAAPVQPAAAENTAEPVSAPVVKEDNAMKKTLHVEGMMCCHCEARVKKALEALPAVDEAVVSHEAGTAIVTLNAEISDADLKKAVEDQDYKVTGIE